MRDIVNNSEAYWFDDIGNSLVVADDGKVYLLLNDESVRYVTDDIRKIYDESADSYVINGFMIDEYIMSLADEPEFTVAETTVTETVEIPAQVIYQTIYKTPETATSVSEMSTYTEEINEENENTKSDKKITAVTEVPEESETEGTETAVSSVPSETGVRETVTEVITLEAVTSTETSAITVAPEARTATHRKCGLCFTLNKELFELYLFRLIDKAKPFGFCHNCLDRFRILNL